MSDQYKESIYKSDNEISLKEVVLKIKSYIKELFKYWWLIVLFIIPFLIKNVYQALHTPPEYTAEIRFLVEGDSGGGMTGIGGLLGSFGFNKGAKNNPFKIIEVAKSKSMISDVIFSKENDFLANEIITAYKLDERWAESNPEMLGLRFNKDSIENFSEQERRAFLSVYKFIIGTQNSEENALMRISVNDDSGIFMINSTSIDEHISLHLTNNTYDLLKLFFEEKIVEDKSNTVALLKEKLDSLESVIGRKTLQIARFDDRNRGIYSNEAEYQKRKLELEIQGLTAAYTETWKNYEVAEYNYKTSKPLFLLIDKPYAPLSSSSPSLIMNIIFAILLGSLLGMVFIIGRKIYRDIMSSESI